MAKSRDIYRAEKVAKSFISAAKTQRINLPGSELNAETVSELTRQVLEFRDWALELDERKAGIISRRPMGR